MPQDTAYYYNSSVYGKLHESYLKRKRNLICEGSEEAVALKVSKTREENPGLSKKNGRKQGKRSYWPNLY